MSQGRYASVLITGASSGLGAALARAYARPGAALFLSGRDAARLEAVATACRAEGAEVHATVLDVTERAATEAWVAWAEAIRPLDLVIANAGISAGTAGGGEGPAQTRAIFATNLEGVIATVMPAVPAMQARGRGQIAIISSLAAFRGFPSAPAYCASKAAVRVWGEGLRGLLAADGIGVSVVCPGFVATPMTAVNDFPMPLMMPPERAARIIVGGLARNRGRIAFPWPLYATVRLLSVLPFGLADRLGRRLPRKR